VPGHRGPPQASAPDRLAMLQLALGSEPRYALDDFEVRSNEPTYTVHTLSRLRSELGRSVPLVFLIGADQLLALDRWKEWKTLFKLAHFGVARRPGYPLSASSMPRAVAGDPRGNPAHRCEAERRERAFGETQVRVVDRVEGSAEDADRR